jgi:hypothetical protein
LYPKIRYLDAASPIQAFLEDPREITWNFPGNFLGRMPWDHPEIPGFFPLFSSIPAYPILLQYFLASRIPSKTGNYRFSPRKSLIP